MNASESDQNSAEVTVDGRRIFFAEAQPPHARRSAAEIRDRVLTGAKFPPLRVADPVNWWREVDALVTTLGSLIEPQIAAGNRLRLEKMKEKAEELERLCRLHATERVMLTDQEPPFAFIGSLRILAEWCDKQLAPLKKRTKGRPPDPYRQIFLLDLIKSYETAFGIKATAGDAGLFARFLRLTLRELSGIELQRDWLRKNWPSGK